MPRLSPFPDLTDKKLQELQERAQTKREFQRVQCLYFGQHGCSSRDIAPTVAMSAVTVKRVWHDYRKRGEGAIFEDRRGGRYHAHLTQEEEEAFLAPFFATAKKGGILVVQGVKEAYEKKVGRRVGSSTVYDLLHRHGWRKIVPRPQHPQGDPVAREKFKASFPPHRSARRA
jgi:transposase